MKKSKRAQGIAKATDLDAVFEGIKKDLRFARGRLRKRIERLAVEKQSGCIKILLFERQSQPVCSLYYPPKYRRTYKHVD